MGNGTEENPYTREDVLRLIKENGGTAEGLDLSEKVFEKEIDLCDLNLTGIILKNSITSGAKFNRSRLWRANFKEVDFQHFHFEYADFTETHFDNALLCGSNFENASIIESYMINTDMSITRLEQADFSGTNLSGTTLWGAKFSADTNFENVIWGNFIFGNEKILNNVTDEELKEEIYSEWILDNTYRRMKNWYTNMGMYDIAGKFYYREMEIQRKLRSWRKEPHLKVWSWFLKTLCGYGENWERVIMSAIVLIFGLSLTYFLLGTLTPNTYLNCLYYSAVSFTALGYGSWSPEPAGWVKGLGAFESFLGVFTMALFLVTFTRKMTR